MTTTTHPIVPLDIPECIALLGHEGVGRLAVDDDEGPVVVPVNYVFQGGVIHIRTDEGGKLDAADRRARASFQVDDIDENGGWSVLIRGRLRRLIAPEGFDPIEPTPAAAGPRRQLIGLYPLHISGRRVGPRIDRRRDLGLPPRSSNTWFGQDGTDLLG